MTEHHSSRIARAKSKDRARQQALRDRRKSVRAPSTHTINRAIAHALMAELKTQRAAGVKAAAASVSVADVLQAALNYLTEGSHGGNSYSHDAVHNALIERIKRDAPKPGD